MKIDGGCHCGAIRYEADIDPASVAVCHCSDCQTLSGSAFRVVVPSRAFRLLDGAPKIYVKTSERGSKRAQSFCANCGTPIYSCEADDPRVFSIRVGTVRQRAELPPKVQIWCRSARDWAMQLEGVPQVEKQPY